MKSLKTNKLIPILLILFLAVSCATPGTLFRPENLTEHMRWVMVKNTPIVYTDQGHGEPLLILSSFPLHAESWGDLANRLSASFRVIVIEPPWLMEPRSMKGDFSSEHLLQIYREFVRTVGIEKTHVMGVGEGGGLAIAFGHHFPEHIRTAISINGFEGVSWSDKSQDMIDLFYQPAEKGMVDLMKMASLRYQRQLFSNEQIKYMLELLREKERLKAVHARKSDLIQDVKSLYILAMIEYINFPTLMIRSDSDSILPEKYTEWARSRIHEVQYHTLQDAGHFAFLDQPEKVAEVVRNFLLQH